MLKYRLILVSLLSFAVLSFSGCAEKKIDIAKADKKTDAISERLVEASNAATKSLGILARVNNAQSRKVLSPDQIKQDVWQNENTPLGLDKKIDIDMWSGPFETVLKNISEVVGYRFRVVGDAPIPVMIAHVSGKDKMIIDYFYDIGYQAGDRADIIITPPSKGKSIGVIEFRYLHKISESQDNWNGNR